MKKFMKLTALLAICMVAIVATSNAQLTSTLVSKHFANDSSHTVTNGVDLGPFTRASVVFKCTDTVNVKIIAQYKQPSASSWTAADTTTINVNSATGTEQEIVYRNNTVEKLPGLHIDTRWLVQFQSSGNGVAGTRNYTIVLYYAQ